jgi:hypothetical protein
MSRGKSEAGQASYVALYPSDWRGGTSTLPPLTEWAYLQLCLEIWDKGKAIDPARLPLILVRLGGDFQAHVDLLISEGKLELTRAGKLSIRRAIIEHERATTALNLRKNAAKRAAESRWKNSDKDARASVSACEGNANKNKNKSKRDTKVSHPPIVPHEKQAPEQQDFLSPIPAEAWEKFEAHRREMGKPLTKVSRNRARKVLTGLAEQGQDPERVIQQTIDRAWLGLFEIKADASEKKSGWRFPGE